MTRIQRRRALRLCGAALAILVLTTGAGAREFCARPDEVTALKTAVVQQELMVAALSCHQTGLYNRFVIFHRGELQHSDAVLRNYFAQRDGIEAYHAYKTRLANDASLDSLHDIEGYCSRARATFEDALEPRGVTLAVLVADRPADGAVECRHRMRVAEQPQ